MTQIDFLENLQSSPAKKKHVIVEVSYGPIAGPAQTPGIHFITGPWIDVGGTSFFDRQIEGSYRDIVEAFGFPTYTGSEDDKIQNEWVLQFPRCDWEDWEHLIPQEEDKERVATVYDWKEYRNVDSWETITWNIGTFSHKRNMADLVIAAYHSRDQEKTVNDTIIVEKEDGSYELHKER